MSILITRHRREMVPTPDPVIFTRNITQTIVFTTILNRSHHKNVTQKLHFHPYSHRIGDRLKKIKPWLRLTHRDPVNQ